MNEEKKDNKKVLEISIMTSLVVSVLIGSIFGFLAGGVAEKNLKSY